MAKMVNKKILFLTLISGVILFLTLSNYALAACPPFSTDWPVTGGCVCNQGYYDTKCYANPQNPSCTLLPACSGQWKSACAPTESKITSVCPGTDEEWMCCGTALADSFASSNTSQCSKEGGTCHSSNSACGAGFIEDEGLACLTSTDICCMPDSDSDGTADVNETATVPQTGATTGVKLSGKGIEIPTGTGLPDPQGGIAKIIRNLLTWLLGIVGVIAIIGFVISGIQYLTSAGDEDRMKSAKRNMLYAIIGVVVTLSSFVVIQAIQYALEARSMF